MFFNRKTIPIFISAAALLFSVFSYFNSKKATNIAENTYLNAQKDREPNLKIIQNLWTKKPRFELINESSSKLDKTPSPSYFMFIPSKLYFMDTKGNVTFSNLILSPFSYEVIEEQIVGNQTNDSIVTSYLPSNFYAKKGYRDMIYNDPHKITDNMSIMIGTMPFIVIISSIDYEYNGDELNTIVLSTPLENQKITKQDMKNIKDYVRDNSDRLEVKINGSESVYQTVQENVEKQLSFMFTDEKVDDQSVMNILGGKEDGGNYGTILKKINGMITPKDPMESSE